MARRILAALIVLDDGRYLMQQRDDIQGIFYPGYWGLFGGAMEPGETAVEALVREVAEETGLIVRPQRIVLMIGGEQYRYRYPNGDLVEILGPLYQCEIIAETGAPLDEETRHLEFFSREKLPKLTMPYPIEALFTHLA